jgi:hypothetical protein
MIRRLAATLAALAMLLVLAVPVMAGGWAEIVADGQTVTPKEGASTEVGFKVMQHGETPAPWENATVHFTNSSTGTSFDVAAKNDRADGHFIATATMPEAGFWSWQVTLANLESDHQPVHMTVLTKAGATPPLDPSTLLAAIDRAKAEAIADVGRRVDPAIERLETQDAGYRTRIDNLNAQVRDLTAKLERAEGTTAVPDAGGAIPVLGVIAISVLAGATAGFLMAWLAGRPQKTPSGVALKPASRGADPV